MMHIQLEYDKLKSRILNKLLNWQFTEDDGTYLVFALDQGIRIQTTLYKSGFEPLNCATCTSDTADFETNYKNTANKNDIVLQNEFLPPNTTRVVQNYTDLIAGLVDNLYVIPNGQTLTMQRVYAASSLALSNIVGSKIQFFEDVAGNGATLNLIVSLYTSGNMQSLFINESFVGNGTRAIRTRRLPLDAGAREVHTRWEGFLR